MNRSRKLTVLSACLIKVFFFFCFPLPETRRAAAAEQNDGRSCDSSCGSIPSIRFPFRLTTYPATCGHRSYELACENNRTVLHLHSRKFFVQEINYRSFSMRVVDPGIREDDCSSSPLNSLVPVTVSPPSRMIRVRRNLFGFVELGKKKIYPAPPYILNPFDLIKLYLYQYPAPPSYILNPYNGINNSGPWNPYAVITYINCPVPITKPTNFVDATICNNKSRISASSASLNNKHSYVVFGEFKGTDLGESCSIEIQTLASAPWLRKTDNNTSFHSIHRGMAYGFELLWVGVNCTSCTEKGLRCGLWDSKVRCYNPCGGLGSPFARWLCLLDLFWYIGVGLQYTASIIAVVQIAARVCGIPFLSLYAVYRFRRRHLSLYENIEEFLGSQNSLMPIRYSCSQIRKMTDGFKNKLGEGGFGSVYKGKLRSGCDVAVKRLGKSTRNGQEFINEVATIGRIHHVNVVNLIGFCVENSERALVYDFMPNGSLEKHIFGREGNMMPIDCNKMYDIALGVARGIEYLHKGCDMRILHFDIKPHNILLNEDLTPKISDFGLAKLYNTNNSIVSLTAARGTMGYMAPELFYKNIGGVSDKADVYSYGMLLMEMASRRKNLNPFAESIGQIYFPSWAYDQISEGKVIDMGDVTEEERQLVEKMIIIALWCIQMKPGERPSMHKVVEMLEGAIELLQMSPKPFINPQEMPRE